MTGCGTVWGSGPYTIDSAPGQVAKHSGAMTVCQTGVLSRTALGLLTGYVGSSSNLVNSQNYAGSFCGMSVSLVSLSNAGSTCFCTGYSGSLCTGCDIGFTLEPTVAALPICVPNANYDSNCISYTHTCKMYRCTTCAAGYTAVNIESGAGSPKRCMSASAGLIRDCLIYQVTSAGIF